MKKIKYLLLIFILLLTGCKIGSFTKNDFITKAKDNGYIIEENKPGYEDEDYINNIYYAINRENAYDIQFLELKNDNYAKEFFLLNANEIKNNITDKDYLKSKSFTNYELYHAENDTNYLIVIRSNNNIIYIDAPIGYINEIEDFLEDLQIDY